MQVTPISPEKTQSLGIPGTPDDETAVEEELVDVPYEYEVEELREQDMVKEEVVERPVPQIKALYSYQGNGMEMEKGEVSDEDDYKMFLGVVCLQFMYEFGMMRL